MTSKEPIISHSLFKYSENNLYCFSNNNFQSLMHGMTFSKIRQSLAKNFDGFIVTRIIAIIMTIAKWFHAIFFIQNSLEKEKTQNTINL